MAAIWARIAWFVIRSLGFAVMAGTAISDAGTYVLEQVRSLWVDVFAIPLPGTDTTVGDWLVMSGIAYFLTIVVAALATKAVIQGASAIWSWAAPSSGA